MAQAKKPGSKASASSSPRSRRTYKAPALEKGLEILECLAAASAPRTLQQLSLARERSASEIYRMLEVLVDQGYVLREAGLHRLSLRLFNLGVGQVPARDLLTVSLPVMRHVKSPQSAGCMAWKYPPVGSAQRAARSFIDASRTPSASRASM